MNRSGLRKAFSLGIAGLTLFSSPEFPAIGAPLMEPKNVPVITSEDYITVRLKGESIVLLDVRPVQDEYEAGHVPGAMHLSINDLDRTTLNLSPDQKLVVTCGCCKWEVCPNALPAAAKLINRGFRQVSALRLADGISSWTATPLEKGPGLPAPTAQIMTPKGPASPAASSAFNLTLINPDKILFPQDIDNFVRFATQSLPQLQVKQISSSSSQGKKLLKAMHAIGLPAAFFDPSFQNAAVLTQWANAGWVVPVPKGRGFMATTNSFPPQVYMDRPQKPNELDLFIMSQCPFGVTALQQTLQAMRAGSVPSRVKLSIHYLINKTPGVNLPNPLQGDPSGFFQSLHGVSELEEDVRQLVISKYFPEKFPAYFLERSKQPTSSLWDKAAAASGLDPAFISKKYNEEGSLLLQKELALSEQLAINSSPTFLWENTVRINNVAKLKTIPPLKNLDIKLQGSCHH